MKRYCVSYVEVWDGDRVVSSWYENKNQNGSGYGSISKGSPDHKSTFHRLISDMVIRSVVNVPGNKVTKTSMDLIEGYDCYYTTANDGKVLVCFVKEEVPKFLPLRLLSELKDLSNDTDENLQINIDRQLDKFHEELLSYRTEGQQSAASTEEELQNIIAIMNDNIDKFLQRQERISLLVDNTNQLNENSFKFQRKSSKIMRKMWWSNVKLYAIVITILLVIIVVISLLLLR
ncbi:unnamed protein product [Kluyveromyces dobzhanskii CBS 2104]|uniref:WGS project CCBQ000000000 data, contig 00058 n=1 Tax=Kluyveromyces dobzhanskii CBS 2104 TaxID=1427455 RepID=A0A0A8LBL4_9SACH|nr:unnamed protein product [Kluyveromyces dobzhanskii CBS 2104]